MYNQFHDCHLGPRPAKLHENFIYLNWPKSRPRRVAMAESSNPTTSAKVRPVKRFLKKGALTFGACLALADEVGSVASARVNRHRAYWLTPRNRIQFNYRHRVSPDGLECGPLRSLALSEGSRLKADHYVFACGLWLSKLFPETLGNVIRPTKQDIFILRSARRRLLLHRRAPPRVGRSRRTLLLWHSGQRPARFQVGR